MTIGDKKVTYCNNGLINKVGDLDIVYYYRRVSKIGNANVQYNTYGEIEKISNFDEIKNSNGDLDIQYSYEIADNNCNIPISIEPLRKDNSQNSDLYTVPYSKMFNPTTVDEKDPDPEIEIILGAFEGFIKRGDYRAGFFALHNFYTDDWVYSIGDSKVSHKMTGSYNIIKVGNNTIIRDQNNKITSIGDIKIVRDKNGSVLKIGNDTVHRYQNGIISAVGRKKYFRNQDGTVFAIGDYNYTTDQKGYLKTISNMKAYIDIFPGKIIYLREADSCNLITYYRNLYTSEASEQCKLSNNY